jgi:GntR family transcriptional regulator/MocR family aminotransferase
MAVPYVVELGELADKQLTLRAQIASRIALDIARGTLKPGARLPGSRTLAGLLGVHRNTVNGALSDLVAQGWVHTEPARGVFVRKSEELDLPRTRVRKTVREGMPEQPGFELPPNLVLQKRPTMERDKLILTGGVPDPRLFPRELLARAYRRALRARGAELLDYNDPRGEPRLRRALAELLSHTRGLNASEDEIIITRGSQQAIWLAAAALLRPGDRVAVECFGYLPAWDALRQNGATLVPLAIDRDGVRIDALEKALAQGPLRAVYLTPHHQYPTMVPLSAPRRLRLLELARVHRFAILEDDYSHEFHYEGRPRLPMASTDSTGQVVYIGSLSKILAPGLRIGYAVAPRSLIERLSLLRTCMDRQGDLVAEAAVAELLEDGEVQRHVRRMRQTYLARRDALVSALSRELGDRVSFDVPPGGMALWVRVRGANPETWAARAALRNVLFRPGRDLHLERRPVPYVRMGYTRLSEREISKAVREAALALAECSP